MEVIEYGTIFEIEIIPRVFEEVFSPQGGLCNKKRGIFGPYTSEGGYFGHY